MERETGREWMDGWMDGGCEVEGKKKNGNLRDGSMDGIGIGACTITINNKQQRH